MIYDVRFKNAVKAIFVASAIVFLAAGCNQKQAGTNEDIQIVESDRELVQVSHQVESLDRGDQLFNFYADEGKTALDLLRSGHTIETKTFSGVGEYVTSIDGKKEDTGKNFWALYVNGVQSQVGASDYKPKDKDKIVWKLEEIKN